MPLCRLSTAVSVLQSVLCFESPGRQACISAEGPVPVLSPVANANAAREVHAQWCGRPAIGFSCRLVAQHLRVADGQQCDSALCVQQWFENTCRGWVPWITAMANALSGLALARCSCRRSVHRQVWAGCSAVWQSPWIPISLVVMAGTATIIRVSGRGGWSQPGCLCVKLLLSLCAAVQPPVVGGSRRGPAGPAVVGSRGYSVAHAH